MDNRHARSARLPARQRGTAVIEFALVFIVFFGLFYAIVSYGLVFVLLQGFSYAANEGARAAIAVDPMKYASASDYLDNGVRPRVRQTISSALSWLPAKAYTTAVGANGGNVTVELTPLGAIRVAITYPDYAGNPLIPFLTLPGLGQVPRVPANLTGVSVIGL